MKRGYASKDLDGRRKIFAELECGRQLDHHIQRILRSTRKEHSGILLSGHKGAGKTFVVELCLQKLAHHHPVLIARHYQQHVKIPYYGFKYGISDYLSKIYNQFSKKEFKHFSSSLKDHLGESFPLLLDYIPELALITGQPQVSQRSMLTVENQLYPLFKRLFEFLADYSGQPVIFFTDDLQWIDASGINLLKYLLLNLGPEKLLWIGACRASQNHAGTLRLLNEELGFSKRRVVNIVVNGLSPDEVKIFLEMSLEGPCHDDLADVCFRISGGNASHLQTLIESLRSAALLKESDGIWTCNKSEVEARYTGQNTEDIFLREMKAVSATTQDVLCVMACIGRFNKKTILDWLGGDEELAEKILKEAVDRRLLMVDDNEIHFADMQIGEMIYNELHNDRRINLHYQIANFFYARGIDHLTSTDFILMVSNFNQAIDLMKAEGKLKLAAELNYKAGKISQQENALDQARYFFKMSSDFLRECPWEGVLDQILPVYMERARIEYVLGEYDLAEIHLDFLLERIPDPVKRARIFELKVTINNHLGRYLKVVRILKESLGELGVELPMEEQQLLREVSKLSAMLTLQEEGGNASNPAYMLPVESRQAILKLLYVGGMGLHHTSDVLMRWAALQIILCSGVENVSGVKAIGCVSYGRMLIISGEIQKGFEFGLKGIHINNTLNDVSLRCRVYGVFAFYIQPWRKAFAESYSLLDKAASAGQKSGDLIGLYIIKTHRLNMHLISGLPLKDLPQFDFEDSGRRRELTYYITHYQGSLLQFLTGKSPVFTMPRQEPSWLAAELTIQEEKFYRNYVWARYYFLFGHYALAAQAAEAADHNRKLQEGSPLLPANLLIWFLSVTQEWLRYPEEAQQRLSVKLNAIMSSFSLWQEQSPQNYRPAWFLLNAEYARLHGDHSTAMRLFAESAQASGENVFHFAVTNELWARHLLTGARDLAHAVAKLQEAIRGFTEWGAVAKVRQLLGQYQAILPAPDANQTHLHEGMDIETIQYELSGDMEVASLINKLMVLLLRISGSTHVVVELVKENGDRIVSDELSLLLDAAGSGARKGYGAVVPVSLMLMALKSQETIIVNDLNGENGMRDVDSMLERGVKSFLILPVTINGHLSMVIYLENTFAANWYLPERVRWARITANQGAVIIENARIHERSVKLNQDLRKEMAEKERLASVIEAQKDAHLRALVQTQDAERKRIAGDLHDSLGSLLSTVKLRFNGLQDDFEERVPDKAKRYIDTIRMLDDAIHEVRQISHNMVPVSLKRFGLKAALETFVEQVNASERLDTRLQVLGLERRLPEDIEVAGYRICQELVQNVIKHAQASLIQIQVIDHRDSLNIIVEDNGCGMHARQTDKGFGFTTIQAKVDLFKGTFEIDSQPGRGAMVIVDLPLTAFPEAP